MPIPKERLAEIEAIPDADIDTSDIPEADEAMFARARLVLPDAPMTANAASEPVSPAPAKPVS